MTKVLTLMLLFLGFVGCFALQSYAQNTEFTFQGSLTDNTTPANGNYDFEFALFDALNGGTQLGSTLALSNIAVANGIFTVKLDFGNQFPGSVRFLEVRVRLTGQPSFTTLTPRQLMDSAPHSIQSLNAANATNADNASNAAQLGGITASGFIQNTNSAQTGNFNVSGNGTVGGTLSGNAVNAATQFNIGGQRALSATGPSTWNTFVGLGAGAANTTGITNTFVGASAGTANQGGTANAFFGNCAGCSNTGGFYNSFFGTFAGFANTTAFHNSFFGSSAGFSNVEGAENSFFGSEAGANNDSGSTNAFFGRRAGFSNLIGSNNAFFGSQAGAATTASNNAFFGAAAGLSNSGGLANSFFGRQAGAANISGNSNVFVGYLAGAGNTSGSGNTLIGFDSGVGVGNLINATALGSQAQVDCSNCLVLGGVGGVNGGTSPNVGIGTTEPETKLEVVNNGNSAAHVFTTSYGAVNNAIIGRQAGGTLVNPTATTNGLALLFLGGRGHTGSGFATVSRVGIGLEAAENWTTAANGTRITFDTTENSTTSRLERMRIDHNGRVGIGTTAPSARLHVFDAAPPSGAGVIYGATTSTAVNAYAVVGEILAASPGGGSAAVLGNNRGTGGLGIGVFGDHDGEGWGVYGRAASGGVGVRGEEPAGGAGDAGLFIGDVTVTGTLSKGGGAFKIDHPLDPANKYLYHSFVESPDMKNIYDGNVTTDAEGLAVVALPDWFESLNRDFRYQLTVIGQFAQAIVAEKIKDNRFKIRTSMPNVEVSWQVTGIRKDPFAEKNRIPVEEQKPEKERGSFLHPEAFGQPEEKGVEWARHPEMMKQIKEARAC